MQKHMDEEYDLLLGRKTYDIFAEYKPINSEQLSQVNKITKYPVSSTLENPLWENTIVVKNSKELKKLKNSDRPDIQVYGSSNLFQALMENNLVDKF